MYRYLSLIAICLTISGLLILAFRLKFSHLKAMFITLLISLFAMLVFNTFLTSLPIVMYNTSSILGVYISSFPVEDIGYLIVAVVLTPLLFEHFCNEKTSKK